MGSKTQQTSQSSTSGYTPYALGNLQDIYNRASSAASTPYTPYTGQLTAGLTDTQNNAVAGANTAANIAQPYYQQAAGYAATGAAPISASDISRYTNPYTQSVVDATRRNFAEDNGQQQQQVVGNAAMKGALGGDRVGVAQAELARQQKLAQDPVIANLQSQGYTQAVSNAQADRAAAAQGAGAFSNIGSGAQSAALQGVQGQLTAGGVQQQNNQAGLDAQYKQYLQAMAYPYQQAQFLAGIGLPASGAMGGTTTGTGTSTTPAPNPFTQIAGLGIAGAGLFLADGGRVEGFADGGSPFNFINDVHGYIPAPVQISAGQSHQPASMTMNAPKASSPMDVSGITKGLEGLSGSLGGASWGGGNIFSGDAYGGSGDSPLEGLSKADYGDGYADGGATFDDRFGAVYDPSPDESPFRLSGPEAMDKWRKSVDEPNPAILADNETPAAPASASPMRVALPKQITGPEEDNALPESAMAFDKPSGSPLSIAPPAQEAPQQQFGKSLLGANLSDRARQSIVAAGLGMAASRSPFALSAIGEGGLQGLKTYSDIGKTEQDVADRKITQKQADARIQQEAKRIAQQAEQYTKSNDLAERKFKADQESGYKPTHGVVRQVIDPDTGLPKNVYGWVDPNTKQVTLDEVSPAQPSKRIDESGKPITGQPFLEGLSPQRASLAKQIGDYKVNPASLSIRGGRREQAIADATAYNPEYDQTQFSGKNRAVSNFAGGVEGRTVRSLNVAIDHLGTLDEAAKALDNGNIPLLNKLVNTIKEKTGSPVTTNFDSIKQVVSAEIAKAVVGGQTALHDRDDMAKRAANSQSPAQLSGLITEFKKLMGGQLRGLRKQYETSTRLKNFDDFLEPQTLKELAAVSSNGAGEEDTKSSGGKYEETKEIGGKKYGRIGKDWFAL